MITVSENPRHRQLVRYHDALENLPASGGGCHVALLSVANLARLAGVGPDRVAEDLQAHIRGTRKVPRSEIQAAVRKAFDSPVFTPKPRAAHRVDVGRLLRTILDRGAGFTEQALWEASPVRIDWPQERDAVEILDRLYKRDETLFIGGRMDADASNVLTAAEWIARFDRGGFVPEHIVPNPLTGKQGLTKDGKPSWRADSCVTAFRFATIESDHMQLDQQIRFWAGVKLPVVALLHSGGKSIHGWVRIDASDRGEWEQDVEGMLFEMLKPLGIDGSCKNEARLSRMPGHFRTEKDHWQKLMYLDPVGRPLQP